MVGYELREDFAARAAKNVAAFLGDPGDRYRVEHRDCYEGIDETDLDRVVLDLPEPWQVVKHAARALHPGGILLAYTPQITQAVQLRETLAESAFGMAETIEVLQRGWHIEGQSVRPDHRMVAHTGLPHPRALAGQPVLNTLDLLLVALRGRRRHRRLPPRVPGPRLVVGRAGARASWSARSCSRPCCAPSTTPAPPSSCSSPSASSSAPRSSGRPSGC